VSGSSLPVTLTLPNHPAHGGHGSWRTLLTSPPCRKLNESSSKVEDPAVLKLPLCTPKVKKITLHFPLGLEVVARNMKGVTIKDALDAIHKQFKKRVSILLPLSFAPSVSPMSKHGLCRHTHPTSMLTSHPGRRRVREAVPSRLRVGPRGVLHPLRRPPGRAAHLLHVRRRRRRQEEEEQERHPRGGLIVNDSPPSLTSTLLHTSARGLWLSTRVRALQHRYGKSERVRFGRCSLRIVGAVCGRCVVRWRMRMFIVGLSRIMHCGGTCLYMSVYVGYREAVWVAGMRPTQ
jgi:hypothetical protein